MGQPSFNSRRPTFVAALDRRREGVPSVRRLLPILRRRLLRGSSVSLSPSIDLRQLIARRRRLRASPRLLLQPPRQLRDVRPGLHQRVARLPRRVVAAAARVETIRKT